MLGRSGTWRSSLVRPSTLVCAVPSRLFEFSHSDEDLMMSYSMNEKNFNVKHHRTTQYKTR
jgi:hypothetical protein